MSTQSPKSSNIPQLLLLSLLLLLAFISHGQIQEKYFYDQEKKDLGTVTVTVLSGTDIIIAGTTWTKSGAQTTLTKVDQTRATLWRSELPNVGQIIKLIVSNDGFIYTISNVYPTSYLSKINLSSGALIWSKSITNLASDTKLQEYSSDQLLLSFASSYDGSKYTLQLGFINKSDGSIMTLRTIGKANHAYADVALAYDPQLNIYYTLQDTLYSITGTAPHTLRWKRQHPNTAVKFQHLHTDANNKLFAIGATSSNRGKIIGLNPANGDLLSNVTTPNLDVEMSAVTSNSTHLFVSWKPIYVAPRTAWLITKIDKSNGAISWHSSYNLNAGELSTTYQGDGDFVNDLTLDTDGNVFTTGVFDSFSDHEGKWGVMKLNGNTGAALYYKIIPGEKVEPNLHRNSSGISVYILNNKLCVIGNIQTFRLSLPSSDRSTPEYAILDPATGDLLTQTYLFGDYEYPSKILSIERDGNNMIVLKQIGRSLVLGKYDEQQNTIWEKLLNEDYSLHEALLRRSPSGRIAIAATRNDLYRYDDIGSEIYSYFFEPDGTLIWRKAVPIHFSESFSIFSLLDLYTDDNSSFIFQNKDRTVRLTKVNLTSVSNEVPLDINVHYSNVLPYVFHDTGSTIKISGHKNGVGVRTLSLDKNTLAATIPPFIVYPAFEFCTFIQIGDDDFIITGRDNNYKTFITRCNLSLSQTAWANKLNTSTVIHKVITNPGENYLLLLGVESNYTTLHKLEFTSGKILDVYKHPVIGLKTTPTDLSFNSTTDEIVFSATYQAEGATETNGMLVSVGLSDMKLKKQLLIKGKFSGDNRASQVETTANGVTWMGGNLNISEQHKAAFIYSGVLTDPTIDTQPPSLIATAPLNGAITKPTTPLTLTFNKPVILGSGKLTFFNSSSDTQLAQLELSSENTLIAGSSVTITPVVPLPANVTLYIKLDEGLFKDNEGNRSEGLQGKSWSFVTDNKVPVIFNSSPNAVYPGKLTSPLEITFSENIKAGRGSIRIYKYPSNVLIYSIDATASSVSIKDTKVKITLPAALAPNSTYYINISSGAFLDIAENSYAGVFNTTWNFNTLSVDTTPPVMSYSTTIYTVNTTDPLQFAFNENVKLNYGNIRIYDASTNTLVTSIAVTPKNSSPLEGFSFNVTPIVPLPNNKNLYIQVDAGLVVDLEGNLFAGLLDKSWMIKTVDSANPTIISKVPAVDAREVSPFVTLMMDFTMDMIPYFGASSIRIFDYNTNELLTSFKVSSDNTLVYSTRVYATSPEPIPPGRHVYVKIDNGALATLFTAPRRLFFEGINDKQWHFTTMTLDIQAPTLISLVPATAAGNVNRNTSIQLVFSENVVLKKGTIDIYDAATNVIVQSIPLSVSTTSVSEAQATVTLPSALAAGTAFYIKITNGSFKDLAGNSFVGIQDKSWSFTTIAQPDILAPQVASQYPAKGASNINSDISFSLEFSENILLNNGSIIIYTSSNDSPVFSIPLTSSNTSILSSKATITLSSPLKAGTSYYVKVASGSFKDLAGNSFAGIQDKSWSFTTIASSDTQAPQVKTLSPQNGAIHVNTSSSLSLEFIEEIAIGSGDGVRVFDAATNQQISKNALTNSNTVINGMHATITLPTALPENTTLYIHIDAGAFKDLAGNLFSGLTDKSWMFTTQAPTPPSDHVAPFVTSTIPNNEEIETLPVNKFTIQFNENVVFKEGKKLIVFDEDNDQEISHIDLTTANTTVNQNTISIQLPTDLPSNKTVYIQISPGTFTDEAGNEFIGIISKQWKFTTQQVVTAIEDLWEKNNLLIYRDGNYITISPEDGGTTLISVKDILGRRLDYERMGDKLILSKPSGIIIIEGAKNNSAVIWKLIIN